MADEIRDSSGGAEQDKQLLTKFVFIDTSAYIAMQFDWSGRQLSKFAEFARSGRLKLLTTEITNGEVRQHLREAFDDAVKAIKKSAPILAQLQVQGAVAAVDEPDAFNTIDNAFRAFLKLTGALTIPLRADLPELFSSYFGKHPPFSDRKKHEFPDAIVVASLSKWCSETKSAVYVVCKDPDLKACCAVDGPLYHAESVAELISQATVSKAVHDLLEATLKDSEVVFDDLNDQIVGLKVKLERASRYSLEDEISVEGKVTRLIEIHIHSVNILDRVKNTFTCELEFEADLRMRLEIEMPGYRHGHDEYEPGARYMEEITNWHTFVAEIVVNFDPRDPDRIELESVYIANDMIEIDRSTVREHLRR